MSHTSPPPAHPIQPYADALQHEHEDNLNAGRTTRITGLLRSHQKPLRETARVVVSRSAGPAVPFAVEP